MTESESRHLKSYRGPDRRAIENLTSVTLILRPGRPQ